MSPWNRCARVALSLVGLAVLATSASAQGALDGQWVKLKLKAKGFTLDVNGVDTKATYTDTVYMFLQADGGLYDDSITYESAPGVWETTGLATISPVGEDSDIVVDHAMTVPGADGASLTFRTTFRFSIKLDDQDALKKATVKSDSGHVTDGTLDGTAEFLGSVSIKGQTIDPDKLPFSLKM